jgi:hypothetical protein
MTRTSLHQIIVLCQSIEEAAKKLYLAFSSHAHNAEHKAFWRDIANDEKRHITYWKELRIQEAKGALSQVFDQPEKIIGEIKAMKLLVGKMLKEERNFKNASYVIVLAFRLESLMLHPAFCIMFSALKSKQGTPSAEDDYQEHVDKFSWFMHKHLPKSPERTIMGEMLSRMWEHSRELTSQFSQIKTLRGLIPICANCKKIRDDAGFWNQIESYLEQKTDAQFTHGICPQCARKLYPDLGLETESP